MKKLNNIGLVAGFLLLIVVVVAGSYALGGHMLASQDAANKARFVVCKKHGSAHKVVIKSDQTNPGHTYGKLCDTLTIINTDNSIRLIAFGSHDDHQPYDGITEKVLGPNQSLIVVLNETGTYRFHDHIHDAVTGDFTVSK